MRVANVPTANNKPCPGAGQSSSSSSWTSSPHANRSPPQHAVTVYFRIQIHSKGQWGLYESIDKKLSQLGLRIVDHRTWHPAEGDHKDVWVANEVHCRDTVTAPRPSLSLTTVIEERKQIIEAAVRSVLSKPGGQVQVEQWYPDQPCLEASNGGSRTKTARGRRQKAKSTPIGASRGNGLFEDDNRRGDPRCVATLVVNDGQESFRVHISPASLQALRTGRTAQINLEPSMTERLHGFVRNYH